MEGTPVVMMMVIFSNATTSFGPSESSTDFTTYVGFQMTDKAQSYLIYKLGIVLQEYFLPVLLVVGILGNILSFSVMSLPKNRHVSCCVFMRALAVSDTLMLCVGVHYWCVTTMINRLMPNWECAAMAYFFQIFNLNGTLLIVCMTVDRFISVAYPYSARTWCTSGRAKVAVLVVFFLMIAYNIPHSMFTTVVGKNTCTGFGRKTTFSMTYSYLSLAINSVVPFLILVIFNILIIYHMRRHRRTIHAIVQLQNKQTQTRKSNMDRQLIVMLMLVTFALLVLTAPQYVRYLLYTVIDRKSNSRRFANYIGFAHFSNKLIFCNHSINFFLYCCGGSKFRRETLFLLSCRRAGRNASIGEQRPAVSDGQPTPAMRSSTVSITANRTQVTSIRPSSVYPISVMQQEPSAVY